MARKAAGEMDETGFTLIELLIVIVVLGILAGVVIFALGGVTSQSAVAACKSDGATISTALAAYNTDNSGLTAADQTYLLAGAPAAVTGGPFLQSWPDNTHYTYTLAAGVLSLSYTAASAANDFSGPYTGPSVCDNVAYRKSCLTKAEAPSYIAGRFGFPPSRRFANEW
jgi:general secretion pathway protein G